MPILTAHDPLPRCPRRIVVAGTAGSDKTTLAVSVSDLLGVPVVDIDVLFHGRDWLPRPTLDDDDRGFAAEPAWVTEWQYSQARALVAARADLLVWLDVGRLRVLEQVTRRAIGRARPRQAPGEVEPVVEPPAWAQLPDRAALRQWARSTHGKSAERVTALLHQRPDLTVVRLATRQAVRRWVAGPLREAADRDGDGD